MWYVPCEWKGNVTNDIKTNMLDVIKGNDFLELKYIFFKWSFCLQTCKLVCDILEKDSKQLKGGKRLKQVTCILPYFDWHVQFFWFIQQLHINKLKRRHVQSKSLKNFPSHPKLHDLLMTSKQLSWCIDLHLHFWHKQKKIWPSHIGLKGLVNFLPMISLMF